jgi:hypothetical protein
MSGVDHVTDNDRDSAMAFAWTSDVTGAAIIVSCLIVFYIVHQITTGQPPRGAGWLAFAAPGFLFLITWAISRVQARRTA